MFKYKAMDKSGILKEGEVGGETQAQAVDELRKLSLVPLSLTPVVKKSRSGSNKNITRKDILNFTNQTASMLGAKLPVVNVLKAVGGQSASVKMSELAADLAARVSEGAVLSEALAAYPKYFSKLYVSVIKAGETGGLLAQSFAQLAFMMEKDEKLRAKLKGAMTYPAVMFFVMVVSVGILMTFVVPKFAGVFHDMGGALPAPTRMLIACSDFIKNYWWVLILAGTGASGGYKAYVRTEEGRVAADSFKLNLPVFGKMIREVIIARFSITTGVLLKSGVPLLEAVTSSAAVTQNSVYEKALEEVISGLKAGQPLGETMAQQPDIFPPLLTGMIATGEKAGNLDEMFQSVGRFYEQESEVKIQAMTTLLEPVVILLMGVVVGAIIVAMLMPVFEMGSMVK